MWASVAGPWIFAAGENTAGDLLVVGLPIGTIAAGWLAVVKMLWSALQEERKVTRDLLERGLPLITQATAALSAIAERTPTIEQYERLIDALDTVAPRTPVRRPVRRTNP